MSDTIKNWSIGPIHGSRFRGDLWSESVGIQLGPLELGISISWTQRAE